MGEVPLHRADKDAQPLGCLQLADTLGATVVLVGVMMACMPVQLHPSAAELALSCALSTLRRCKAPGGVTRALYGSWEDNEILTSLPWISPRGGWVAAGSRERACTVCRPCAAHPIETLKKADTVASRVLLVGSMMEGTPVQLTP